jgi:hypothetical protein
MFTNFRILLRFFEILLLSLEVILAKLKDDLRRSSVLTRPVPDSGSRLRDQLLRFLGLDKARRPNLASQPLGLALRSVTSPLGFNKTKAVCPKVSPWTANPSAMENLE